MGVEVAEEHHLTFLHEPLNQTLGREYSGVQSAAGVQPLPIEVDACQVAAIAPVDHAVDVQHGHYFEHEVLTQNFSFDGAARQLVHQAVQHLTREGFPRVHTRGQHNAPFLALLVFVFILVLSEVCDGQVVT